MDKLTVFAERMKKAREQKGIKQNELARRVAVTPQTISAYEKSEAGGKGKNPTLDNAVSIAKELGVSLDWLCALETDSQILQGYEYKTSGDIARAIVSILEKVPESSLEVVRLFEQVDTSECEYPSYEDIEINIPAIAFKSGLISKFIAEWKKIKSLYDERTIDERLYRLWLKDRFESLDNATPQGWAFIDLDNDGPLPF